MRKICVACLAAVQRLGSDFARAWDAFWFTPVDPATLGLVRAMCGFVLLVIHVSCLPNLLVFIGPHAWIDSSAVKELAEAPSKYLADNPLLKAIATNYSWSVWYVVTDPVAIYAVEGVFLVAFFCLMIGYHSRIAAIVAWVGHLSFVHRGYITWFGMDAMLAWMTFYLMWGPTGAAYSVDRWLARYRAAKRALLGGTPVGPALAVVPSWTANVVLRLIQIHMGIVYFCAGVSKLQGATWWNGYAGWLTLNVPEYAPVDMSWLGHTPDPVWQAISIAITYGTLIFEIAFIFLVWFAWWRPLLLVGAVLLHAGIGLFMGLIWFGVTMLAGCAAFLDPAAVRWFVGALFEGRGGFRYLYDREQPWSLQQAALVAATDGLNQIEIVPCEPTSPAPGTLIDPKGTTFQGRSVWWALLREVRVAWLLLPVVWWGARQVPVVETPAATRPAQKLRESA